MWLNFFFQKLDITNIKLLVGNSAIKEMNELKYIKFTFKIFRMQFLTFIATNPSGGTRLILKQMSKRKDK